MIRNKQEIRKAYLAKRLALSDEEAAALNTRLLEQCKLFPLPPQRRYVHLFLPITAKKEVDTYPLAVWLREQYPDISLVLSRSYLATASMQHYLWDDNTTLIHNSYGIPEPEGGQLVTPKEIDVVFVPLLAFDEAGHRVGYGKGMYDTFLRQCREDVLKIGLSLFEPVPGQIEDVFEGDVPMDHIITPERIYTFTA
ncbi:5-formyltetrahydrofolate cyclo-ligase [Chitinophaga sp. SYP-B3965]|uniref:5-formyltetrahydrofolate cyclo-ligase n=1 Tax=Chitinophaga sp. SYP-B3965 TaxID=2663120 RepID=UPI00129A00C1|nr:5-formyltetrahydrofolate cyclo-ligase [Chitinophaga sp. SYP-B3965]MRG44306.1 5-formyltetrahydrofolate cyclo-ligase [Chitinophaga sp. SYP-B3965]